MSTWFNLNICQQIMAQVIAAKQQWPAHPPSPGSSQTPRTPLDLGETGWKTQPLGCVQKCFGFQWTATWILKRSKCQTVPICLSKCQIVVFCIIPRSTFSTFFDGQTQWIHPVSQLLHPNAPRHKLRSRPEEKGVGGKENLWEHHLGTGHVMVKSLKIPLKLLVDTKQTKQSPETIFVPRV